MVLACLLPCSFKIIIDSSTGKFDLLLCNRATETEKGRDIGTGYTRGETPPRTPKSLFVFTRVK